MLIASGTLRPDALAGQVAIVTGGGGIGFEAVRALLWLGASVSELAGTGVTAFTIGPGLVATATAAAPIEWVAPRLGLSLNEFYSMNRGAMLSAEAAGAAFASAVALAERYGRCLVRAGRRENYAIRSVPRSFSKPLFGGKGPFSSGSGWSATSGNGQACR